MMTMIYIIRIIYKS